MSYETYTNKSRGHVANSHKVEIQASPITMTSPATKNTSGTHIATAQRITPTRGRRYRLRHSGHRPRHSASRTRGRKRPVARPAGTGAVARV
jgi:hypothetical protein